MSNYTISTAEAVTLTTHWRVNNPNKVRAFCIDKAEMEEIFSNSDAVKVRTYIGSDSSGERLVLVGVDSAGKDILSTIYDHTGKCPDNCDETSILNVGT